jgi:hypothetical protein
LLAEMVKANSIWRAAARRATESSMRYHYIRVLGAIARRTLVSEQSQLQVPAWAVALRNWEGGLKEGAANRASIECLRASRNYHLASARRERIRWWLTKDEAKRAAIKKKYDWHIRCIRRSSKRLVVAMGGRGGQQ